MPCTEFIMTKSDCTPLIKYLLLIYFKFKYILNSVRNKKKEKSFISKFVTVPIILTNPL